MILLMIVLGVVSSWLMWDMGQDDAWRYQPSGWGGRSPNLTINGIDERIELAADAIPNHRPVLLLWFRVEKFEITFAVRRVGAGSGHGLALAFNATDLDDYDYLKIWHADTKQAPHGFEVIDGAVDSAVTETSTDANMPILTSNDVLWVRVTNDASTVTVKCATTETDLESTADCYWSTAFDNVTGMIGLAPLGNTVSVDDLTVKHDRDSNGTYETTVLEDGFAVGA